MNAATDPAGFNMVAKLAFAPVYEYLAERIVEQFAITEGTAIDAGSGPGSLAIALARITRLQFYSLDICPEMTEFARANVAEAGLAHRIETVTADVCQMPFADETAELVISRGSIFFWDDRPGAFREIWRILKPGGAAYCGGGMGSEEIRAKVEDTMARHPLLKEHNRGWQRMSGKLTGERLLGELAAAGISGAVARENGGLWVKMIKGVTP